MTQVTFEQAIQIAVKHYEAGQLQQSEAICRQLLAQDQNHADALHLLGLIAHRMRHQDAAPLIQRAIALQPNNGLAYGNLALVLLSQSRWDEALECSKQALALQPNIPQAHYNLGYGFHMKGELENAIACYRRALLLRSDFALPYLNLGAALDGLGRDDEAIDAYRRGLELQPDSAQISNNLSHALWKQGRIPESMEHCRRAIALDPNYPEPHVNLSYALISELRFEEAEASLRRAIALRSDYAEAHCNLAIALLTTGKYEEGWREREWRLRKVDFFSPQRNFTEPRWDGSDLNGKTILLQGEAVLGDALQFVRFAPHVARRGGRVVIECKPSLLRLFQGNTDLGAQSVVVQNERGDAPPVAFDVHSPLASLPLALGMFDPAKLPTPVPYLQADALSEEHWRQQMPAEGKRLNVGLAWAGSPAHPDDRLRSITLATLARLARSDVQYYSLQVGSGSEQAASPPPGMELIDLTSQLGDFADTAGLVSQLDLVICVDTAVAHLAGAMGKAVWVLIAHRPDYRWLLDREDTPWYPTMRLFRQKERGDWDEVVERVAKALDSAVNTPTEPREN
jgi:tetratricopeptide (TPR) repeat protein